MGGLENEKYHKICFIKQYNLIPDSVITDEVLRGHRYKTYENDGLGVGLMESLGWSRVENDM